MAWSHSARHSSWSGTDGGGPSQSQKLHFFFFLPYMTCTGTASATIWFGGSGESCGIVGWFSAWTGPFRSPPSAIHLGLGPGVSERGKEPHVTDRHAVLLLQVSRRAGERARCDIIGIGGKMYRPRSYGQPCPCNKKNLMVVTRTHCIVLRPCFDLWKAHARPSACAPERLYWLLTRSFGGSPSNTRARIQHFAAVELAREISLIGTPIAVNNRMRS